VIRRNDSMSHMTVSMTALKMRCFHTVMTSIPNHEVAMFVRVLHVCCVCQRRTSFAACRWELCEDRLGLIYLIEMHRGGCNENTYLTSQTERPSIVRIKSDDMEVS